MHDNSRVIAKNEGHVGFFAGIEILALTAVLGLNMDPFDIVRIDHRMINTAGVDMGCAVFNGHGQQMLFVVGFDGIGKLCIL